MVEFPSKKYIHAAKQTNCKGTKLKVSVNRLVTGKNAQTFANGINQYY